MVRIIAQSAKAWCTGIMMMLGTIVTVNAQQITYTDESNAENIRTEFEVIGKVDENILVFKNDRGQRKISVYDFDMRLRENIPLHARNQSWINVDFIPYPSHVWMIYQYVEKGVVYCMAAQLNKDGQLVKEPIQLDTTKLGWTSDSKIYSTVFSDNKQNIMVFKVNTRNPKLHLFTTLLFNSNMQLEEKSYVDFALEEKNDQYTEFLLDNQGNFLFGRFRKRNNDQIKDFGFVVKYREDTTFNLYPLNLSDVIVDEVVIKIDNTNKRYLLNSFYTRQRRGNVEGLYMNLFDVTNRQFVYSDAKTFNDEIRQKAKSGNSNLKMAFNDFYINNIIIRKDGGFVMVTEEMYASSNYNGLNRWDMMGWGGYMRGMYGSPYGGYWPYGGWGWPGFGRYNYFNREQQRFNAENISVFSFDKDGRLEWNSVIAKSQYADNNDNMLSYAIVNTGGQLHFIHNTQQRRTVLLSDASIAPDGSITTYPTLRNLMKNVQFMPKFAKQVGSNVVIIPCQYRNSLMFAKVEL
ncbi:hypothetical protein [Gynurincola endophyticus]|uniref:hypothetical protein n=1 Tax=Gynurincola endophyticus TaxID=2479004 RepID=UPI000F8D5AA2|nr:hypothetical protein [Gynurincola endophyticus]